MRRVDFAAVSVAIRERCRTLGFATLRCDLQGTVLERDDHPALAAIGPRVEELVAAACQQWAAEPAPTVSTPGDHAMLVPVPEGAGRTRRGYTVALVVTGGGEQAARSAEMLRSMLRWMAEDVSKLVDNSDAVNDLTVQLTDSYETLDALYAIGRAMQGLGDPTTFINAAVQRLHASLRFTTIFVKLGSATPVVNLRDRVFLAGRRPGSFEELEKGTAESLLGAAGSGGFRIVTDDPRVTSDDHREALVVPLIRAQQSIGALVGMYKTGNDLSVSSYDIQLMESTAGFLGAFLDNVAVYEEQRQLFLGTVHALTAAIDAKDRYTHGHSERVAHLSAKLAQAIGMTPEQVHRVWIAGLVHDVGKIGVPEAVLCKQGKLTDEEFGHIKRHPEIGHHILKDIAPLADVLPGVMHHHEKFDGRGYPAKLVGEAIPVLARIIALADTFDAMSSTRSYRPAMPREKVLEEIRRCAGTQFDPDLALRFVELDFSEFDAMLDRSRAADAWAAAA
ncbi:MAG: hypothetical protein GIKADHBN_03588 [Phycisphaerales bacterium]|nr:hypothetical protein [Phycisphaerales bacterium]